MDFVFWSIDRIAGTLVWELPLDCLANAWGEIAKRHQEQTNSFNHAAAIYMEYKSRAQGEKKLNYKQWLPYNTDSSDEVKQLSPALIAEIENMDLPPRMMSDLYHQKLIPPPKKQ